jgi:hypothetical protein
MTCLIGVVVLPLLSVSGSLMVDVLTLSLSAAGKASSRDVVDVRSKLGVAVLRERERRGYLAGQHCAQRHGCGPLFPSYPSHLGVLRCPSRVKFGHDVRGMMKVESYDPTDTTMKLKLMDSDLRSLFR